METVKYASEIANSQVVWSILCILMTAYVLWNSHQRESKLLDNLKELTDAQGKQAEAMQDISKTLETLEGRVDRMEKLNYANSLRKDGY